MRYIQQTNAQALKSVQVHKQLLASIVTALCVMNSTPTLALHYRDLHSPYAGFDIQERQMKYKKGFGDNLLNNTAPQGNIYTGIKLIDALAVELGFEATKTKNRTATLQAGDIAAGALIPAGITATFRSQSTVRGPHVNLVGFYGFAEDPNFKLIGSIGVGLFRGVYERHTLDIKPAGLPSGAVRTFSKNKAVARLSGGIQYMLGEHLGARLTGGWVNTTRISTPSNDGGSSLSIRPRNTTFLGFGVLWAF